MRRTGYTLLDLLIVVIVLAIVGAVSYFVLEVVPKARATYGPLKDSVHVRGIHQGMLMWAQNNQDRVPLPSELDAAGHTLKGDAAAKDTTANIISMMIYHGFFSPDLAVSPKESNPNIRVFDRYQYSDPSGAANPKMALWDPDFTADFTTGIGSLSYAMSPLWSKTRIDAFNRRDARYPVLGNRGPQLTTAAYDSVLDATAQRTGATSNTDLIHGGPTTWEGYIVYGDNSVNLETTLAPVQLRWHDGTGRAFGDLLFWDEPGDTTDTNAFLGIFVSTGATKDQWRAIWD